MSVAMCHVLNKSDLLSRRFCRFDHSCLISSLLISLERTLDHPRIVREIDYMLEVREGLNQIHTGDYHDLLQNYVRPFFKDVHAFLAAIKETSLYPKVQIEVRQLENRIHSLSNACESAHVMQ